MTTLKRSCLLLLLLLAPPLTSAAATDPASGPPRASFNFNDTDLRTVIKSVARLTGRNFIIDPRVKGKVTIVSSQPLPAAELYDALLDLLRVHGYTAIEDGAMIKVVPLAQGRQFAVPVETDETGPKAGPGGRLVTRIHKLHHVPAAKLVPILTSLLAAKGQITAHQASNTLIITGTAANLKRLLTIINRIDRAGGGNIETVRLEHADAREVMAILQGLEFKTGRVTPEQLQLVVDDRTNSILLAGDPDVVLRLKALIAGLDTPVKNSGSTQVIFLRYAKAKNLAKILTGMDLETQAAPPGAGRSNKPGTGSKAVIRIEADEYTNALIVTAPPAAMKTIQSVVRQLDIRRAQVMIEAIIAEVSTTKAAELGVQWQATDSVESGNSGAIGGTNFNSTQNGITQLSVNPLSVGDGLSLGYFSGTTTVLGTQIVNLGVLLRALASDSDTNILSTPSLVTLDNEEAEIVVGQNVPFVTGSYTSTGSSTQPTNPFQTIERRDIGVKLTVTPQINEGDTIRLDIFQEVSNLTEEVNEGGTITNNRSIKTSVLVENGKILVLGGLISDDVQEGVQKVPLLGDIPILGLFFRYNRSRHVKRNLMVFLKPVIIRDESASSRITFDKYDLMRQRQQEFGTRPVPLVPALSPPVLPERRPAGTTKPPSPGKQP